MVEHLTCMDGPTYYSVCNKRVPYGMDKCLHAITKVRCNRHTKVSAAFLVQNSAEEVLALCATMPIGHDDRPRLQDLCHGEVLAKRWLANVSVVKLA